MIVSGWKSITTSAARVSSARSPTYDVIRLPETSRHASMRSSSDTIGVRESPPTSSTQRLRAKLSTTATSWPLPENRIAVGQPR